ncbi:MAG: MarR family transcriptional regulator [Dysgonamonadaceae bacterium]|nr:MarR family transcriptional regulator [Dysgonamonadaceae bacterium]
MDKNKQPSPFVIENLEEDSGFLMLQVSRLWEECHDRVLKKHCGVSEMQYAVLASIYWLILHSNKQVTQAILAKHTKIDPMTISQMFKVLEKQGYIYRTTHATDIRAKAVYLTQQGIDLMHKAIPIVVQVNTKFFQILGKNLPRFNSYMVELLNAND